MDCNRISELLSEYIDHRLPPSLAATVEEHLARCPGCYKEYGELRQVVDMLRELPAIMPPPEFHHRLHRALQAQYALTGINTSSGFWSRVAKNKWFKTAAVAAVAFLSFGMLNLADFWREPAPRPSHHTVAVSPGKDGSEKPAGSDSGAAVQQTDAKGNTVPSVQDSGKAPGRSDSRIVALNPAAAQGQKVQRESSAGNNAGSAAGQQSAPAGQQTAPAPAGPPADPDLVAPKVIRQAVLSLAVSDVDEVTEAVSELAWRNGGMVAVQGDNDNASMVLKVPVSKFDKVYDVLQNMGIVMDKKLVGQDVTSDYYQAVNTLQELEQKQSAGPGDARVASAAPENLQQEKAKAENKLRSLEDAVTMATIQVKLNE